MEAGDAAPEEEESGFFVLSALMRDMKRTLVEVQGDLRDLKRDVTELKQQKQQKKQNQEQPPELQKQVTRSHGRRWPSSGASGSAGCVRARCGA